MFLSRIKYISVAVLNSRYIYNIFLGWLGYLLLKAYFSIYVIYIWNTDQVTYLLIEHGSSELIVYERVIELKTIYIEGSFCI